ncbi:MAG: pyrimidine dimer DNA glycosylase/endonuclease V [Candidatus Bathyarchaeia archaeon]
MRLWSIHPKYLDAKGLISLWREGLLAKKILEGRARGYANHPQLIRFRTHEKPIILINAYLYQVFLEAKRRKYKFNPYKIEPIKLTERMTVTRGQLGFELSHLLKKLEKRDKKKFKELKNLTICDIEPNPIFKVINGGVEAWERSRKIS